MWWLTCATLLGAVACGSPAASVAGSDDVTREMPPRVTTMSVARTELLEITSDVNSVRYRIAVALPNTYRDADAADQTYPLLVALDSHYSFLIARNIVDHLSEREDLPEVVVVGVGYEGRVDRASPSYRRNRTRDYTPTFVAEGGYGAEHQKHSGGGPVFLRVLETEILPTVREHYRVGSDVSIVGHSFGGLFVVNALLERPDLWRGVIAVSPSLWYDEHYTSRRELQLAGLRLDLGVRLYMAVGSREVNSRIDMVSDLQSFARQLEAHRYGGLEMRAEVLDDETHNSVFPRALSNGLRWIYESR